MKIARVFPRRTKATPDDELAFTDCPPMFPIEVDEIHISDIMADFNQKVMYAHEKIIEKIEELNDSSEQNIAVQPQKGTCGASR